MAKYITPGVHTSSKSGAVFIDMAAAPGSSANFDKQAARVPEATIPYDQLNLMPWALWGTDNLLPNRMIADIETCGILNAIIDGKARLALCEGIIPVYMKFDGKARVIDRLSDDAEILDFLEDNNQFTHTFGWMKDLCGFGDAAARLMLNKGKDKVVLFQRDDITEMRYEKKDNNGRINNLYYSGQWDKNIVSQKDNRLFTVPLLNPANPLGDLQTKAAAGIAEHAFTFRSAGWGKHYYPVPLWYGAYKWVKIAQGVPEMKAAMFENNMRLKYMVVIYDKYWESAYPEWDTLEDSAKEEKRSALYDEIDKWLTGSKNAYKSIYVGGEYSLDGKPIQHIEIKPILDTTQAGELLPDSAAANSEIAFAMMWNNAMTGGNQKNGLYQENQGGSNVREATAMQVIIHELERKQVQRFMNIIKRFNGWDKKYQGLEFIIPGTILTTLDTGAGTKPIVNGANQNVNNGTNPNNP